MRRASFATIANVSLWETIRRSLATTFITLLPVARAVLLRRLDAEGLRVRAARRRHLGCVLVDLHRGAAADHLEGARARVRAPQGQPLDRGLGRRAVLLAGGGCGRRRADAGDAGRRVERPSPRDGDSDDEARSGAGSGARRGPMDVPGNGPPSSATRSSASLTLLGPRLDDVRSLLDDVTSRWRGDALRVGEETQAAAAGARARARPRHPRGMGRARAAGRAARAPAAPARRHANVRNRCYRGSHGMRMGRAPVRSRLLLRTRDLDVRRS